MRSWYHKFLLAIGLICSFYSISNSQQHAPHGNAVSTVWTELNAPVTGTGFIQSVAIGPEQDVVLWNDGTSLHLRTRKGDQWEAWKNLDWNSDFPIFSTRMISWGLQRLDVFVVGNGSLYHRYMDHGQWGTWENLGGTDLGNSLDLVAWSAGRLDVFVNSRSGALQHLYWDKGWGPWEVLRNKGDLRGYFSIKTVSWVKGRIDVFLKTDQNTLLHQFYDQGWSEWEKLGESTFFNEVVLQGVNRLDLYSAVQSGEELHLHRKTWKDFKWSDWQPMGYQINPNTSCIQGLSRNGNTTDLFFNTPDGSIVHGRINFNTGQKAFRFIGNQGNGVFAVNSSHTSRMDVYWPTGGNALLHLPWKNQAWKTQ